METLQTLPKVELHQHLGGSLPPEATYQMLIEHGLSPVQTLEAFRPLVTLQASEEGSFSSYFRKFQYTQWATQYADCLERAAYLVASKAAAMGVKILELRYAPQLHLYGGLSLNEGISAVLKGLYRAQHETDGLKTGLILSAIRNLGPGVATRLAEIAVSYPTTTSGPSIIGFDLSGAEIGFSPKLFQDACKIVREGGLGLTAHLGEEDGPHALWEAIDLLGLQRIGHGCTALKDTALLRRIAQDRLLIECCQTSNYHTGAVQRGAPHPILRFLEYNIPVAICTDNTTVSSTNQIQENALLLHSLSLSDIKALHIEAASYSFLSLS